MDKYKEYIYKLRDFALNDPYIIINDDISPKLKHYIQLLDKIQFVDGSYHTFYGEIKNIVNSFTNHWTEVMDDTIKEADKVIHLVTREELLKMMDKTIQMHQKKQADFETEFSPINTPLEQEIYDNILTRHDNFMKRLQDLKESLKILDKQEKVKEFAKDHFQDSLKRKNDVFVFTYNFISFKLTLVIDRIRVSLEEIFNRIKNNVQTMQEKCEVNISHLLIRLYEKNKEHLSLSRKDARSSVELAEVQRSMEILKDKIEDSKHVPMQRLEDECNYWEERLKEFYQIEKTWKKLQMEENNVLEQEKTFNELKDIQIPEVKKKCWENMDGKFRQRLEDIREMKLNAAKALLTFFSVRGPDRIFYSDNVGTYYVGDLGHQCYVFDYGLNVYHVNCDGQFVDPSENQRYFYDNNGRFIITETGEKLYQIAPCASTYNIQNDIFVKQTKDCGHSEAFRKECRLNIKDLTDKVVLPDVEPVDIRGKLDPESQKYLWDAFGHILPDVLCDAGEAQSKSPIHYLAHNLLMLKHKRSESETMKKKIEASTYREKIHQNNLNKLTAAHASWKAKQVKRRKPEESDDTEERFVFNSHVAQQDFIRSLDNYHI